MNSIWIEMKNIVKKVNLTIQVLNRIRNIMQLIVDVKERIY